MRHRLFSDFKNSTAWGAATETRTEADSKAAGVGWSMTDRIMPRGEAETERLREVLVPPNEAGNLAKKAG